jgi:hypothetical protein
MAGGAKINNGIAISLQPAYQRNKHGENSRHISASESYGAISLQQRKVSSLFANGVPGSAQHVSGHAHLQAAWPATGGESIMAYRWRNGMAALVISGAALAAGGAAPYQASPWQLAANGAGWLSGAGAQCGNMASKYR